LTDYLSFYNFSSVISVSILLIKLVTKLLISLEIYYGSLDDDIRMKYIPKTPLVLTILVVK